jgi:hypothetical protein
VGEEKRITEENVMKAREAEAARQEETRAFSAMDEERKGKLHEEWDSIITVEFKEERQPWLRRSMKKGI